MSEGPARSCIFVIFGATGDLMRRKLLPALFHLSDRRRLPDRFHILGVARSADLDDERFRAWAHAALDEAGFTDQRIRERWCERCLHYQSLRDESPAAFEALATRIDNLEADEDLTGNRVFYLALPPQAFGPTITALGGAALNKSKGWVRLVIEKPFGRDLASALELNELVHRHFDEAQVYRIDHYLGKDTVQNLLALRFGNALFESVWNRDHIKCIFLTVAETLGVEQRGAYYEKSGALRDMLQNHLAQLLTLIAMEPPAALDADSIRFEKIKVLKAVAPLDTGAVVRGQYAPGSIDGRAVAGYRQEPGVAPDSGTETFIAARIAINNWRWQGVPFLLRTGKRLDRHATEISIHFRRTPLALFKGDDATPQHRNTLTIAIQPDEGFALAFAVKTPGEAFALETRRMTFRYRDAFGPLSAGYETLLLEIIDGNQTLFVHAEETIASWRLFGPLLEKNLPLHAYAAGSSGPAEAAALLDCDGVRADD